jgi:hypothetical protein
MEPWTGLNRHRTAGMLARRTRRARTEEVRCVRTLSREALLLRSLQVGPNTTTS